jgi:hypothetical protein
MNSDSTIGIAKAHDSRSGHGYGRTKTGHPATGRTPGNSIALYQYKEEEESDPEAIEDEVGMVRRIINRIRNRVGSGKYYNPDASGRKDVGNFTGTNATKLASAVAEDAQHTTPVVHGLSPRITYRQKGPTGTVPRNTKGPAFGTQSTAQYIRDRPGRISGTQYGSSRAPLPYHDEDDESIFTLFDLKDPMERSFISQQQRVNRIKRMINEIERE